MRRIARISAVLSAALVTVLVSSGAAFADGDVTWKNKNTGNCLGTGKDSPNALAALPCVWLGLSQPYVKWTDQQQGDGGYVEHSTWSDLCLDGNWGSAYSLGCNGGDWQHWREISTSTGWMLQSVHTGWVLDSNHSDVYTNPNYGDGDTYQRWG